MDRLSSVICQVPLLGSNLPGCKEGPEPSRPNHHPKRQKTNTAPDGQVLPEWLTWSSYETTVGDQVYQTGEILQLPLTYYGPSIPLGPDWTYGGITSPALVESSTVDQAPKPSTESIPTETSSPGSSSPEIFTPGSSPRPPNSQVPSASSSNLQTSTIASPSSASLNQLQTGAGPLGTRPSGSAASPSSPIASPSAIIASPSLSPTTTPSISGTSFSFQSTDSGGPSTASTSPTPSPSTLPASQGPGLVPLLPAILAPLLTVIAILLLLIFCFRRRERSNRGYTTAIAASSGGFGGWLTSSFSRRANGSGERFTSAWTQVVQTDIDADDTGGAGNKVSPVSAENWSKSNERSALLGFIPNHHRASSSIDVDRPPLPPKNEARTNTPVLVEKQNVPVEKEEELETMADQSQSLLPRLNLGLGWLSVASLVPSRGSGSNTRVASGHTLERGAGGPGALGVPKLEPIPTDHSSEKTETGSGADKSGTASGSGNQPTTSGSGTAGPGLSEDQLFYRAPHDTTSSRGSTPSRKSPRRGFFSRFMGTGSSAKSKRSSGPSRKSWISEVVPEGEEVPLNPGHERNRSEGMSISVPLTPSTVDGERKLGPARWDSRERLRFPLPPSGSAGSGERESLISSNPTEYHSAQSQYSQPSRPGSGIQPTPAPAPAPLHRPFAPEQENFARPALSPFGSREDFSPAQVSQSHSQESKSRIQLKDLFAGRPSLDSGADSDLDHSHGQGRRSFAGQPIVDDSLLHAMSKGVGRGQYAGLGGIDEFGQTVPVRAVSGEAPRLVTPSRWSRGQMSEIASFHSGPSHLSSKSSYSGESGQEERLLDPRAEVSIKAQALRGRRSQPQLIHRPSITLVKPNLGGQGEKPMPWSKD